MQRFLSVDPLADKYAGWSPYNYTMNNPVRLVDPDGLMPQDIVIVGSKSYQKKVMTSLMKLAKTSAAGYALVMNAIKSDRDLVIFDVKQEIMSNSVSNFSDDYSTLAFDIGEANTNLDAANGANGSPLAQTTESSLAHELAHFENGLEQLPGSVLIDNNGYSTGIPADEPYAVEMENRVRGDFGLDKRTHYGGLYVAGKEAFQKGANPYGYGLRNHNRTYSNSNTDATHTFINGSVKMTSELRKGYKVGGAFIDRYLKKGSNMYQVRISNDN